MITPNKYTNIDLSVLNIGAEIVKILKRNNLLRYDDLVNQVVAQKGRESREVFIFSLSFLFSLSIVKYYKTEDIFELL